MAQQKTISVGKVISHLESHAPSTTAEEWDNVGLLAGDPNWKTSGAIVCVDLTRDALEAAKAKGYKLIINHHPCIFPRSHGISRLVPGVDSGTNTLIFEAVRNGIAIAAYHTNFDKCALEVVRAVSEGLGVQPVGRLLDHPSGSLVKLVVFVPKSHAERVRNAICEAGAGHIGNYDFCTFNAPGEGTFRGNNSTRPFLGKPGKLEKAEELRVETIIPRGMTKPVISAMCAAHPYEEVAYDLYPVEQQPARVGLVKGLGYGFWGEFPAPSPFSDVTKNVKQLFQLDGYWLTDSLPTPSNKIKKIAFAAGKGASFLDSAVTAGCDLFITGEAGYHTALDGARKGIAVIELGHRESERFFVPTIEGWLSELGISFKGVNRPTQRILLKEKTK